MRIIRVHYKHQSGKPVKNTYVDFELSPNQETVDFIEIMEQIPEHFVCKKLFKIAVE